MTYLNNEFENILIFSFDEENTEYDNTYYDKNLYNFILKVEDKRPNIIFICTQNSKSNNEDDIELINKIKVIGANCIPPILTWPTYDSIKPGAKIIKTSATNLHQYLPPNMPPDNEMKTILETLEWSNVISFPLTKEMKYTKNKKITRKDYNDEKQLKREKRNYDEIKV